MQSKAPKIRQTGEINSVLPTVSRFELDNGVSGLFIDIPGSPAMSMEACFRAGDYLCPKDKLDLGHFLEHLVLMANKSFSSHRDFSRAMQAYGGYYNARSGPIDVVYEFETPDLDWARTFDLSLTAVSSPSFLPTEFESEKNVVRQEHKRHIDDPEVRSWHLASRPMGYPSGRADECLGCLDLISLDDIKSHYGKTHTASNFRFVVAGHLSSDRRQLIEQKLSSIDLPKGEGLFELPKLSFEGSGLVYESKGDTETTGYCLIFSNGSLVLSPQERVAARLLSAIFLVGHDSWIYGQARDDGLIYALAGHLEQLAGSVSFDFSGQISHGNLEPLIDIILGSIGRLLAGDLPEDQVEYQKNQAIGSHHRRSLTPDFWIRYFREDYFDRDLVLSADYPALVESVDKDQIIAVAQKIFGRYDWTLGLVGNVPDQTQKRVEDKLKSAPK